MEENEILDTPQKRLDYFIRKRFANKADFAAALGVPREVISKYTRDGGMKFRRAVFIRRLRELGLNTEWYLTGVGKMDLEDPPDKKSLIKRLLTTKQKASIETISDFVEVPMVESSFPCGKPEPNDGTVTKIPLLRLMIGDVKNPYVLKCEDDLMEPTILKGDYVIVEAIDGDADKVANGEIVVAFVDGEVVIRRFTRSGDYCVLLTDNVSKAQSLVFKKDSDNVILGIVRRKLETVPI